jgi:hypothetical protein
MKNFPNPEFPINSADCAEIEAIFIELMRLRDAGSPQQTVSSAQQLHDLSGAGQDFQSL